MRLYLQSLTRSENSYCKVFDSEEYAIDELTYKKLSESIAGELMIDTFYSIEAVDTDNDVSEELVCRQYDWTDSNPNLVGEVVLIFKITSTSEIVDVHFEAKTKSQREPAQDMSCI